MSTQIPRRPLPLPAVEPRCEPTQPCSMRFRCARVAATTVANSLLKDYSTGRDGGTALCYGYYELAGLLTRGPRPVLVDGEEEQG